MSNKYVCFESYLESRYSLKTVKIYSFYVKKFLDKHPDASTLDFSEILDYLYSLKKKNLNKTPMILGAVKCFYTYLLETGQRNSHPCRMLVNKLKKKSVQIQDLFTEDELMKVFNSDHLWNPSLKIRNKIIFSLIFFQGALLNELNSLTIEDIDFQFNTVRLKGSKVVSKRNLTLNNIQLQLINEYITEIRPHLNKFNRKELFLTVKSKPFTQSHLANILECYKPFFPDRKFSATTVRQSRISNMLNEQNLNIEDVQLFAGHKWPSTTERYKRLNIQDQQIKINKWHPLERMGK